MGSSACGGPPYPADAPGTSRLKWSQDGKYMIFAPKSLGVFVVDAAGTRLWSIPDNEALGTGSYPGNFAPALSPDGSRVAYVTFVNVGISAIETADLDGRNAERLTPGGRYDTNPTWSPDGSRIAFTAGRGDGAKLAVMDADGSNLRLVAPSVTLEKHPRGMPAVWSHDGRWIAFVGQELMDGEGFSKTLYTIRPDGSELTTIGEVNNSGDWSWSPDGSRLSIVLVEVDEETQKGGAFLYTVRPDGTNLIRVTEVHSLPAWSPEGTWLAFARLVDQDGGIYVVRPDGTELRQVIGGYGGPVLWSADGSEIFVEGMKLAVQPDGSGLRPMYPEQADETLSAWSSDGSQLAVLDSPHVGTSKPNNYPSEVLYTLTRSGTGIKVLVRGDQRLLVAEHSNWRDVSGDIAACKEGPIIAHPEANEELVPDCENLLALRQGLAGDAFLNWSATVPIIYWTGVEIEGSPGNPSRVTGLNLSGLGLSGSIPIELKTLTALTHLRLDSNQLVGTIPSELGNLANLKYLDLSNNRLEGSIPRELEGLSNLKELYLQGNGLTGCVAKDLSKHLVTLESDGLEYCVE